MITATTWSLNAPLNALVCIGHHPYELDLYNTATSQKIHIYKQLYVHPGRHTMIAEEYTHESCSKIKIIMACSSTAMASERSFVHVKCSSGNIIALYQVN